MANTPERWFVFVFVFGVVASLGVNANPLINLERIKFETNQVVKEVMVSDLQAGVGTNTYSPTPQLHQELMCEVIRDQLTATNVHLVVKFASDQEIPFLNPAYMTIYETIQTKRLDDGATFHLAYQINQDFYKGQVMSLMNMFPLAVRTILRAPTVCIKNRGYGEYLYAAGAELNYDLERRYVFTWRPLNAAGKEGDWKFVHIEKNKFHIVNSRFGEFLYAEDSAGAFNNTSPESRRIFSWLPDWKLAKNAAANVWAVEMEGEDVFIRNVHYNEYLYAEDEAFYDDNRREVFTWVPKTGDACKCDTYQCRWTLYVC